MLLGFRCKIRIGMLLCIQMCGVLVRMIIIHLLGIVLPNMLCCFMFAHIFACDSITAFGSFVVPEVNNIIDILFFVYFYVVVFFGLRFFIWFLPSSSISLNVLFLFSCMLSIHISVFRLLFSFSCTFLLFLSIFRRRLLLLLHFFLLVFAFLCLVVLCLLVLLPCYCMLLLNS